MRFYTCGPVFKKTGLRFLDRAAHIDLFFGDECLQILKVFRRRKGGLLLATNSEGNKLNILNYQKHFSAFLAPRRGSVCRSSSLHQHRFQLLLSGWSQAGSVFCHFNLYISEHEAYLADLDKD